MTARETSPPDGIKQCSFWRWWSAATALLAALAIGPSFRFWFHAAPHATPHEFDWFAGLLPGSGPLLLGKCIFALCFLALGILFVVAARRIQTHPPASLRSLILALLAPWIVYALGWPLISPDVFYYLAKGTLQSNYGLDPFLHSIADVPGFTSDPILNNVYRGFVHQAGNYGPVFQAICAAITWSVGGSLHLSLLLFKVLCAVCLIGSAFVVSRLLHLERGPSLESFFLVTGSPLLLFTFLTCAHNDALIALGLACALVAAQRRRPFLCGLLLGTILAIKVITLIVSPFFGLFFLKNSNRPWRDAVFIIAGFFLTAVSSHLVYPGSWQLMSDFAMTGFSSARNSLTVLLLFVVDADVARGFATARSLQQFSYILLWLGLALYWTRSPRFSISDLCLACAAAFVLYLTIAAQIVVEWYLLWPWLFLVIAPGPATRLWIGSLSIFYLPAAMFTIQTPVILSLAANLMSYLLLFSASIFLFLRRELVPRIPRENASSPLVGNMEG